MNFYQKAVTGVIALIAVVLLVDSFTEKSVEDFKPKPDQKCEGEPIRVDYAYHGGMHPPHACAPQCEDEKQRYILYSNGKATQCELLPGCLDWGEDEGVTCIP